MATASGAYDFVDNNLNRMLNMATTPFADWLEAVWVMEPLD
jgi:hypothetical protein